MDIRKIIANLQSERDRIDKAIAAIQAINSNGLKPPSLKPGRLSAAGRRRIAEAAKARWAEHRKKAKQGRRHRTGATGRKKRR